MTPEPENISDKNALTFETLYQDKWLTLEYCGLPKIPKLSKAINQKQIASVLITNLRRYWAPDIKDQIFCWSEHCGKGGYGKKMSPKIYTILLYEYMF